MKKLSYFTSLIFFVISLSFFACDIGTKQNPDPAPVPETPAETPTGTPETPKPVVPSELTDVSSVDFAKMMTIGWNLGNTLDATATWTKDTETAWGMPKTTQAMIQAVHDAGFETIRIPISWHNHVSGTNYKIDSTWMDRVKTIVDWAYDDGMYVIINIHHDNLRAKTEGNNEGIDKYAGFCLSKDAGIQKKSKEYIESIWKQIATTFADYDNHLIFEVLNEPRDIGGAVWGNEWWIGGATGKEVCKVITAYEQVAVDTIRSISGNENRFIMVPGYAASASDIGMLDCYTMPEDTAKDKLLLSGHAYTPYPFAMDSLKDTEFDSADKLILDDMFAKLKKKYIDKGIGIVMGEASASDKDNTAERIKWTEYYFGKAKEIGIPVVLWDNMVLFKNSKDPAESHGYFDRKNLKWYFPEIMTAMMKAAGGTVSSNDGDDNSGNSEDNNPPATFTPVTILDAENYTGSNEVVTLNGKKYIKITIDGYNTHFNITPVDCNGASNFEVTCFAESAANDYQVLIGIKDANWKDVSIPVMNPVVVEEKTISAGIASGEAASSTMIAGLIQPMAQNPITGEGVDGVVFYINKIIVK